MTTIKQMEIFLKVADCKSFTKAAVALYMTQPAISWQIKMLEKELDLVLFSRNDNTIELTEVGNYFYHSCKQMLAVYRQTQEDMEQFHTLKKGHLHIGASSIPGEYILPKAIIRFGDEYPDLRNTVTIGTTSSMIEELINGSIDFAVVGAKIPEPKIEYIPWLHDEIILVTAANSHVPRKLSLYELKSQPLIMRERGSGSRIMIQQELQKHGIELDEANIFLELSTTQGVINALLSGVGMSFISIWAAQPLIDSGLLVRIDVDELSIKRDFYIAIWQSRYLSRAASTCWQFLLDYAGQLEAMMPINTSD